VRTLFLDGKESPESGDIARTGQCGANQGQGGKPMRLSVLTPTLNRRCSFLPRCLESVRRQVGQTFTYEHIVIDDGSTDGTWDYLKELEIFDAHIKAVSTDTSSKQAHALYCGLR